MIWKGADNLGRSLSESSMHGAGRSQQGMSDLVKSLHCTPLVAFKITISCFYPISVVSTLSPSLFSSLAITLIRLFIAFMAMYLDEGKALS